MATSTRRSPGRRSRAKHGWARRPTPLSPTAHGVVDYMTSAATAALPHAMKFPKRARLAADALAGTYGALSSVTNYPPSLKRLVPFKVHGAVELAIGAALPFVPWLLGFQDNKMARNFFFGLSAMTLVSAVLTDWREED